MGSTIIDGVDYGPLAGLVGEWKGDKGTDIAPAPGGARQEIPYFETITFQALGNAKNANSQVLSVLFYTQVVSRKSDGGVFHHQVGYWTWEAATGTVSHSLTIPRSMTLLAGGEAKTSGGETVILVRAALGDRDWGVAQSPFLRDKASTKSFSLALTIGGDSLHYREVTMLDIYGKSFEHADENRLARQRR